MNDDTPDKPPESDKTLAVPPPGRQDSGNALPVGMFLDEFELRSVAGEGGFSIVYRAWDHSLKRQVALKEYFPSGMVGRANGTQVVVRSERHTEAFEAGLRSFVEEARLLAQFDHPALIKVYRFWKANGSAYMVMPFCEGITLRDDWRGQPEPPDEAALMTLLDPLTDALGVLHAERWYHRDIAPDNVMLLAGTRRPLLLDFGAARQVIGDMTHALTVILKPGYAPIEQWGEVPGMKQGPWTDVYALGAMIHFGIMRRTPPPSVGRLINDNYEPLVQAAAGRYSERFLAAVDHALAVRPDNRTQTIAQFRDEIGLNEFQRERTLTWMPTQVSGAARAPVDIPTAVLPASQLPGGDGSAAGAEFTQKLPRPAPAPAPAADEFEPRTQPVVPAPAPPQRRPALLFGLGLAGAAVVGAAAFLVLKPGSAPPAPAPGPVASAPSTATSPAAVAAGPGAAPSAAPAADPTPQTYDLATEFQRLTRAQTAGHQVDVTLVRTTVRSDKDSVAFTVKSSHDGVVYVFNRGSDGSLLQIYPNRKSGLLRIRKDQPLDLPRAVDDELRITGPSGTNDILVMVSRHPRDHSALPSRNEAGYAFYPTGAAAAALAARHPGPLPWFAGKVKCPSAAPCDDEFGAAIATLNIVQ